VDLYGRCHGDFRVAGQGGRDGGGAAGSY
jgi:hypothetical protein